MAPPVFRDKDSRNVATEVKYRECDPFWRGEVKVLSSSFVNFGVHRGRVKMFVHFSDLTGPFICPMSTFEPVICTTAIRSPHFQSRPRSPTGSTSIFGKHVPRKRIPFTYELACVLCATCAYAVKSVNSELRPVSTMDVQFE